MTGRTKKRFINAVIIIVFMLTPLFAQADGAPFGIREQHRTNSRERTVTRLPPRHRSVWVGRSRYFYDGGHFYRKGPGGYIVVSAPVGAIVLGIPVGSRAVIVGGLTYYVYGSVYYRRIGSGYLVVEPPAQTVVIKEISPVVPSEQSVGEKVLVAVPLLNVRSGPGITFPVIREIRKDQMLTIHGYAPEWLYVELQSGEFGWVMLRYTSSLSPPASG